MAERITLRCHPFNAGELVGLMLYDALSLYSVDGFQ